MAKELNDKDYLLIIDLINIAWNTGAARSPQMGQALEDLRRKALPEPKE